MHRTYWLWFVRVVLLTVGISYTAPMSLVADADSADTSDTGNAAGTESMSMPALLQDGSELEERIYLLLRGLKFPNTIGSNSYRLNSNIADEIELLREQVKEWKRQASDFLISSDDSMLRVNSVLPVLYFSLATKILQVRMLTGSYSHADEIPTMRVPTAMAWSAGKAFQDMLAKQLRLEWQADSALISLREEFISDMRIGMAALNPNDASHLQATKHVLYRILYAQLLRNEYYQGDSGNRNISLPDKILKNMPERMRILSSRRDSYSQAQLVAAMHSIAPRLTMPADGLEKPLHADKNWQLVIQLRKDFPHLQTFTDSALTARMYSLITEEQRAVLKINTQEDFAKFLILGECLLFPNVLSSAVKQLDFTLDGSEGSNAALARVIRNAKLSAIISVIRQLRIQDRSTLNAMNKALIERRDKLNIDGAAWYQAALLFLPTFKQQAQDSLVNDLVSTAKQIHAIEDLALTPVSLAMLNKSLWRTFHVDDFSGEFQRAIAEVTKSKDYAGSRKVYFQQLASFLQRLQGKPIRDVLLAKMSIDDIKADYLLTALDMTATTEGLNLANSVISDRTDLHHVSQAKALLRYGEWFGFFSPLTTASPKIDDLPLTAAQKDNYFLELKYSLIDRYPLLEIEHNKKPLHELLASVDLEPSKRWGLISEVLERQHHMIVKTIKKVDKANSASDLKYLLAHSYPISSAMQEYAGLYPIHREKTEQFGKPSKFWKDLEALDHKYVGAFFMFLISFHLGEWIMGKHPSTRKIVRYTAALQRPNQLVVGLLASVLFAGIILEWVAVQTFKVFVLSPHKLNTLYDYYETGSGNDKFLSRTLLDYIELEQKSEKLNYGFEGAMHGIFVGWFGYQAIIKRMLSPKITAEKTKKLLQRVGIEEPHKELVLIFDSSLVRERSEVQVANLKNKIKDGVISEIYGKEQIRQVLLARKKLEKKIAKIARKIEIERIKRGGTPSDERTELEALIGRRIFRTEAELQKAQDNDTPLADMLLNYDEAITFSLLQRKESTADATSSAAQKALQYFGLPANFFEATKPENMEKIILRRYRALNDSYQLYEIEERYRLKGMLSSHRSVLKNEIKRIMQSLK